MVNRMHHNKDAIILLLLLSLSLPSLPSWADTLIIPLGQQGQPQQPMPHNGQSQYGVRQHFGEPQTRHPSVGQPPIVRWDYPHFSVYFEGNRVINSVQRHHPTPQIEE